MSIVSLISNALKSPNFQRVFVPGFLISTLVTSIVAQYFSVWVLMLSLIAYLIFGFVLGCIFVATYSKSLLSSIEQRPKMYGTVREVEAMYIFMLLFIVNIRPLRLFRIKRKLVWSDWFNFVLIQMKLEDILVLPTCSKAMMN